MIEACPNPDPNCHWYERVVPSRLRGEQDHGCHSNLDHIVPKRFVTNAVEHAYVYKLKENKQQICVREHEEKTFRGDEPMPEIAVVIGAVRSAYERGEIQLSHKAHEQAYRGRDGTS